MNDSTAENIATGDAVADQDTQLQPTMALYFHFAFLHSTVLCFRSETGTRPTTLGGSRSSYLKASGPNIRQEPGSSLSRMSPACHFTQLRCVSIYPFRSASARSDMMTEYLEKCGIAWPNPSMFFNPWPDMSSTHLRQTMSPAPKISQAIGPQVYSPSKDKDSHWHHNGDYVPNPTATVQLPRSASLLAHAQPNFDPWASRSVSSSSYSLGPDHHEVFNSQPPGNMGTTQEMMPPRRGPTRIARLPSDQIRQIVSEVSTLLQSDKRVSSTIIKSPCDVQDRSEVRDNRDRTISDVTMHTGCTGFPECTTDAPGGGELTHVTPAKSARSVCMMSAGQKTMTETPLLPEIFISAAPPFTSCDGEKSKEQPAAGRKRTRSPLSERSNNSKSRSPNPKRKVSRTSSLQVPMSESDGIMV